jgi:hypothetical protein
MFIKKFFDNKTTKAFIVLTIQLIFLQDGVVGAGSPNDTLMWNPDANSISDHHLTKLREQVSSFLTNQ